MQEPVTRVAPYLSVLATLIPVITFAQSSGDKSPESPSGGYAQIIEEVLVTASKKTAGEELKDVPAAITAYSSADIDRNLVRNLGSLTAKIPNVALDQLASVKGVANFSIRGLGMTNSSPTIDPTVGVFIDGMYLGVNNGVVMDTFDLEAIEVLRGPQGVLFGRNATGGAVLFRTSRPDGTSRARARLTFETGPNVIAAGSVEGSMLPDKLFGKLTTYFSNDVGYFDDVVTERRQGEDGFWFARPTVVWKPRDTVNVTFIGEIGRQRGDGPATRNTLYAPEFKTASEPSSGDLDYGHAIVDSEFDVPFGNGKITDILAYRQVDQFSQSDNDGSPQSVLYFKFNLSQWQVSNELRYAGTLKNVELVTGLYYFKQDIYYILEIGAPYLGIFPNYGGTQDQSVYGVFANADIALGSRLTLGLGARYSYDKKHFGLAVRNVADSPCSVVTGKCTRFDAERDVDFNNFSPRVSLKYDLNDNAQVYALYSVGARSGGFNLVNSSVNIPPPFDQETAETWEVGLKGLWLDRRLQLNLAAFINDVEDAQHVGVVSTPVGSFQTVTNVGSERFEGIEAEGTVIVGGGFSFQAHVGTLDGKYKNLVSDLNADGVIDDRDYDLEILRLSPLSYGAGVYYDGNPTNLGSFNGSITWDYRDEYFLNDQNTLVMPAVEDLSASIGLSSGDDRWSVRLYGKNLLNTFNLYNSLNLVGLPVQGMWQIQQKGRILGVEADFRF